MKRTLFISIVMLMFGLTAAIQHSTAQTRDLKKAQTLHIDRRGGSNGASIAWHPIQKKYYAVMAGDTSVPMDVFDAAGKMVSSDELKAMFDVRGLWCNPSSKTIQANGYDHRGYDDLGWAEYKLDGSGIPVSLRKLPVVVSQPDPQSVGAYNPSKNVLYFFDYAKVGVEVHKMKDGQIQAIIPLHLGIKTKADVAGSDNEYAKTNYNQNSLVYTCIPGAEIGLLNFGERQIELYNIVSGLMTQVLKLPNEAPVQNALNFSYANGMYWLFDQDERTWYGCK